jgi:hypothetical protein
MVDTLEKMGISRSFSSEINTTLDMIYRWRLYTVHWLVA